MMRKTGMTVAALLSLLMLSGCGSAEWKEVSSAERKYKVMMPGTPKETVDSQPGQGQTRTQVLEEKNVAYIVTFTDFPGMAREPPAKIEQRLNGARDAAVRGGSGKLVKEEKITLENKHPGRHLEIDQPANKVLVRARIYCMEGRLYQVLAIGTKSWMESNSKDVEKFLDSFALLK